MPVVSTGVDLTDEERDLILRGLFELTITYVEDDEEDCFSVGDHAGLATRRSTSLVGVLPGT